MIRPRALRRHQAHARKQFLLSLESLEQRRYLATISGVKWVDTNGNAARGKGLIQGVPPQVVCIIDVSGSTSGNFDVAPGDERIPDLNQDGTANTILDAEIAGFEALLDSIVEDGLGDTAKVALVAFSDEGVVTRQLTHPSQDSDQDGLSDLKQSLRTLRPGGGTYYEKALQQAAAILTSTPAGQGNVVFLSDGAPTDPGKFNDEVSALLAKQVKLTAFGAGAGASLTHLQVISPTAQVFTSTNDLIQAFSGVTVGTTLTGDESVVYEPGLAGVTIYLDTNNNNQFDSGEPSTITKADDPTTKTVDEGGTYTFTNVAPGTYTVREVLPNDGSWQTYPLKGEHAVTVAATSSAVTSINFGNAPSTVSRDLIVRNTNDSFRGSLRRAMVISNRRFGVDNIVFDIPQPGTQKIQLVTPLPVIGDPVNIYGQTQTDKRGGRVELDGYSHSIQTALQVNASDSVIDAIGMTAFSQFGMIVRGDRNRISHMYIGDPNSTGSPGEGNPGTGILFDNGAEDNVLENSVITNNNTAGLATPGVWLRGVNTRRNRVSGNLIGVNEQGIASLAPQEQGVLISAGAQGNIIGTNGDGTNDAQERNVISGNTSGVTLRDSTTTNNRIAGNYIGIDATGKGALPNAKYGVMLSGGAHGNIVGSNADGQGDASEGNYIAGNTLSGIHLENDNTDNNFINQNVIGLGLDSTTLPNNAKGIEIVGGSGLNRVRNNVISGNKEEGVSITGVGTDANILVGNFIGLSIDGRAAKPNEASGVAILGGAKRNRIGTDGNGSVDEQERNIISGNLGNGVLISNSGTSQNIVAGNSIGVDTNQRTIVPNVGNRGRGILINQQATSNRIGTDGNGIADAAEANVIGGNLLDGIRLNGTGTSLNTVAGNYVGIEQFGFAIANQQNGIVVSGGATSNRVGTNGDGKGDFLETNMVSYNKADGLRIEGPQTANNRVAGNTIGLKPDRTDIAPNTLNGLVIADGATKNIIGSAITENVRAVLANFIAGNKQKGIVVSGSTTTANSFRGNAVYANTGLEIDLNDDGRTANDAGDQDTGPNGLLNSPVLSTPVNHASTIDLRGSYSGAPSKRYQIDVYVSDTADAAGLGQGKQFLTTITITTNTHGVATIAKTLSVTASLTGKRLAATASDTLGNTSEFSLAVLVPAALLAPTPTAGSATTFDEALLQLVASDLTDVNKNTRR